PLGVETTHERPEAEGGNLEIQDGTWFALPTALNAYGVGENNRVLLGQFTTDGIFSYKINIQVLDGGVGGDQYFYLWNGNTECMNQPGNHISGAELGLFGSGSSCGDPAACNFDGTLLPEEMDNSTCDFESCAGCTDPEACDYNENVTIDDGSCGTMCPGCTDPEASNYDENAGIDNGSCSYLGCTNPEANNWDSNATEDDGSCIFSGCTDNSACNYNPIASVDDGSCNFDCPGCTDENALNYDPEATVDDGSCLDSPLMVRNEIYYSDDGSVEGYPEGATTYRIYANIAPGYNMSAVYALMGCPDFYIRTTTNFWNSDFATISNSDVNPFLFDLMPNVEYDSYVAIGDPGEAGTLVVSSIPTDPFTQSLTGVGSNLEIEDGAWFGLNNSPNVIPDENGDVLIGQFTTTGELSYRLNIQLLATDQSGPVEFYSGCNEPQNTNLGLIYPLELCNLPGACNYVDTQNEELIDNNTCEYDSCTGCTDPESCHFDSSATIDDGSCDDTCYGCTSVSAINYSETAEEDDGSCLFAGCNYPNANNYDPDADLIGLEFCDFDGCTDNQALNYNMISNGNGTCIYECENEVLLEMEDLFGDGWTNNLYIIIDADGNLIASGDLESAASGDGTSVGAQPLCLPEGDYTIELIAGDFPLEVLWSLDCLGGDMVSGSSPSVTTFTVSEVACVLGCTDPDADNYDENASVEFDCVYMGCTNPIADNYYSIANDDDGSCLFLQDGFVFYDANNNGEFDSQFDYGIANQDLILTPGDIIATTDDNGYYSFGSLTEGDYTITLADHPSYPINTTSGSLSFSNQVGEINDFDFGLSNEEAVYEIDVDFYPWGVGYPCNGLPVLHNISFRNMGNTIIDGYVEVEYDELFAGHSEITPIDNAQGNTIQMEFENLYPGEVFVYNLVLLTPGVDAIGEYLSSTARVYAHENGELVAYGEEEISMLVTCAYDPNDKQAFPQGYEEPHFVLNDTEIEYLVRFQNTGNAAATTVTIRDTLSEFIDLTSFNLKSNSHCVLTTVDPATREVLFTFNNIMLPDSTTDEPGSHGMVSYSIRTQANLPTGTVIENTAHIIFDTNPAIVTNTTWHTIYECAEPVDLQLNDDAICLGETVMESVNFEYIEEYQWSINNEEYSNLNELTWTPESAGMYDLSVTASNPLCSTEYNGVMVVNDVPTAEFTVDGAGLTANTAENYQWFFNGEALEGETSESLMATQNGEYSVQTTNSEGCSSFSDAVYMNVVGVSESNQLNVLAYPNPVQQFLTVKVSTQGTWNIDVLDAAGRVVSQEQFTGAQTQIDCSAIAAGTYTLRVFNEHEIKLLPVAIQR
ncbi:MAG: DUF7619 domain-containing protein, partial [Flavobacteriales bacterium]